MYVNNFIKKLMLVIISMLLAGCLSPAKLPSINQYILSAVSGKKFGTKTSRKTILVTTPTAAPAFETSAMRYSMRQYQIQHFNYNRWVAPPTDMLLPLITQSLRNSHYYKAVVSPPYSGISDYRLDTKILDFQQRFLWHSNQFHFVLQATLINNNTQQAIATRTFSSTVQAAAANPQAGVVAANLAVKKVLQELTYFCVKTK